MDMHEEIAKIAYELYEKKGRSEGGDIENWLEAERIVMESHAEKENAAKGGATPKPKKKAKKAVKIS